jgi:hypothetical protein
MASDLGVAAQSTTSVSDMMRDVVGTEEEAGRDATAVNQAADDLSRLASELRDAVVVYSGATTE